MAIQEGGWPLGLQPLNVRLGLARNHDYSGSISFNTTLTASPTSSADSSSDLDTQSTGSFFHDKSVTLGSLIGVSSILELSKRSVKGRKTEAPREKRSNNNNRSKVGLFSLCSRDSTDAEDVDAPSLGHFLTVERRAAGEYRRNHSPTTTVYGPDSLPWLSLIQNRTRYLLMAASLLLEQVLITLQMMITIMEFQCCFHACVDSPPSKPALHWHLTCWSHIF
ncbi:hypothetical protein ES288_D05G102100v1 [Gossypium darwinii]|uniref:Uncharacterized protein n=1 Tax=Gossypium darwinii TaxID=34276 RepID=A0A5D2CII5_GOSDA|nr:hypothetical protein ES288_D05G102100v1 [Gossypium darwinii]